MITDDCALNPYYMGNTIETDWSAYFPLTAFLLALTVNAVDVSFIPRWATRAMINVPLAVQFCYRWGASLLCRCCLTSTRWIPKHCVARWPWPGCILFWRAPACVIHWAVTNWGAGASQTKCSYAIASHSKRKTIWHVKCFKMRIDSLELKNTHIWMTDEWWIINT